MYNQSCRHCGCQGHLWIVSILLYLSSTLAVAKPAGYTETGGEWQKIQLGTCARQTWEQNRPPDYVYDLERECDCPYRAVRIYVISCSWRQFPCAQEWGRKMGREKKQGSVRLPASIRRGLRGDQPIWIMSFPPPSAQGHA